MDGWIDNDSLYYPLLALIRNSLFNDAIVSAVDFFVGAAVLVVIATPGIVSAALTSVESAAVVFSCCSCCCFFFHVIAHVMPF